MWSGVKTSGEGNAYIRIAIVGIPVVDVDTIGLEVTDVDQLTVRSQAFLRMLVRGRGSKHTSKDCGGRYRYEYVAAVRTKHT